MAIADALPNIELKNIHFADAVVEIGKKWKINILADAYFGESMFTGISMQDVPKSSLLKVLKELFATKSRQVNLINGVYVIRSQDPLKFDKDTAFLKESNQIWSSDGQVSIQRLDGTSPRISDYDVSIDDDPLERALSIATMRSKITKEKTLKLPAK